MKPRGSASAAAGAFNLVELVVVVTALVALASLLAPALFRAGQLARANACADNQRQLGQWVSMYSPSGSRAADSGWLPAFEDGWIRAVATAAALKDGPDPQAPPRGAFACPSQASHLPVAGVAANAWWRGSHYGLNQHLASRLLDSDGKPFPFWTQAKRSQIKDPSSKLLLADASGGNYFGLPNLDPVVAGISRLGRGWAAGLPPAPAAPLPNLRHLDHSGNFLFLDGHGEVRREWPEFMTGPGTPGYTFWHGEHWYPGSGLPAPRANEEPANVAPSNIRP